MTRRTPGKQQKTHKIYLRQRINFKQIYTGSPTRLETRSSFLGRGKRFSSFPKVQAGSGVYPRSDSVGTWYFPGGRVDGREVDHSRSSNGQAKNMWICISTPHYTFTAWTGTTHIKKDKLVCHYHRNGPRILMTQLDYW